MTEPLFVVLLSDLDFGDKEIDADLPIDWLQQALEGTEATARGVAGHVEVTVSKNGQEVMIRGRIQAPVQMPCSRTLVPTDVDIDADLFLMLAPRGADSRGRAGRARAKSRERAGGRAARPGKKGDRSGSHSPTREKGKGQAPEPDADETELSAEDAAQDTYSGEQIVLDRFFREFILLDLPLFPLHPNSSPAISPPSSEAGDADGGPRDPRLAPLAALAGRMRKDKD